MDKYLKMFEPAMKKWLSEHYSPEEAKARWERTVALDEKWIREEGDLGGPEKPDGQQHAGGLRLFRLL